MTRDQIVSLNGIADLNPTLVWSGERPKQEGGFWVRAPKHPQIPEKVVNIKEYPRGSGRYCIDGLGYWPTGWECAGPIPKPVEPL